MKIGNNDLVAVVPYDLRALLFWAAIGIGKSHGGSYEKEIEAIIDSYAKLLNYKLERRPKFGSMIKSGRRK